jgi:hypothetical protein
VNKVVEASLKLCQSFSFLSYLQWQVIIMCISISELINTSECSHGRHSAPQTQAASLIAETGRPWQRHAQGRSYVDLTVEVKLDPKDPLYTGRSLHCQVENHV